MTNLRIACVAIVKNEQNHVAEWIAYQLAIGFDTVIVFDNQSTDDTAARIRAFAPHYDVRLHEWTMTSPDYQTRCYEHAARSYADEFDWLAFFDIDEFLVLDPGFDLKSILNLYPTTPAIGVPWAMFGSSGHIEKPDGLLIEAFTHRSEPSFGPNRHIKSIIRPKHMLYCHNAHSFAMDGQYRSLTGKPLTFTQGGLLDTDPDYTLGKLHHYFTRSRAHWADKMQRGYHDTTRENAEFEAYDRNEIEDKSAFDHRIALFSILKKLKHYNIHQPDQENIQSTGQNHRFQKFTTTVNAGLIFDVGMSEGNDTDYYLKKGFSVVGVEADPQMYQFLLDRFQTEIRAKRLIIYNNAAGTDDNDVVKFFKHKNFQGISGLSHDRAEFSEDTYDTYYVCTVNWEVLTSRHGIPYYLKIDIEGNEEAFLNGFSKSKEIPEFVSVECHKLEPVEKLYEIGYTKFMLVDQNPAGGFVLPANQMEGHQILSHKFVHSSGPFGRDLADIHWVDIERFRTIWLNARSMLTTTWFDCHAWAPHI